MSTLAPPKVASVEVVASQPTRSDHNAIASLSAQGKVPLQNIAYVVKIQLEEMPPVSSCGWALYINDKRIPKYWAYNSGIYFKVFDPKFLADCNGQPLRFSMNGVDFIETGKNLSAPTPQAAMGAVLHLPIQADVLK